MGYSDLIVFVWFSNWVASNRLCIDFPSLSVSLPSPSPPLSSGVAMSDEAGRQTRSQKRAQERDSLPADLDVKKVKLEACGDGHDRPVLRPRAEASTRGSNILNSGEVKATIKLEVQAKEEPVDMSTAKR